MLTMGKNIPMIRESLKIEIDTLPEDVLFTVRDFVLFEKHRSVLTMDDSTYLNALPGMAKSIHEGIKTSITECVPCLKAQEQAFDAPVWDIPKEVEALHGIFADIPVPDKKIMRAQFHEQHLD